MKKMALFIFFFLSTAGFAEHFVLENQTPHPMQGQTSKIAIQWASTAKEVDENNKASMHGIQLNPKTLQTLTQSGKVQVHIPNKAEYFRIVVWSKGEGQPDYVTNWVDIVPNKIYKLEEGHLFPSVLLFGMGC